MSEKQETVSHQLLDFFFQICRFAPELFGVELELRELLLGRSQLDFGRLQLKPDLVSDLGVTFQVSLGLNGKKLTSGWRH